MTAQLFELSRPFTGRYVKEPAPGKHGRYVPHNIVTQRALSVVGPHSFEVTDVIRGWAPAVRSQDDPPDKPTWPSRENVVVGCLASVTATIDGVTVTITEVGTVDQPAMHHDAENLKKSASDAYKRCWMRLGLGLHLWVRSPDDYFLDAQLSKNLEPDVGGRLDGLGEVADGSPPDETSAAAGSGAGSSAALPDLAPVDELAALLASLPSESDTKDEIVHRLRRLCETRHQLDPTNATADEHLKMLADSLGVAHLGLALKPKLIEVAVFEWKLTRDQDLAGVPA